MHPAQQPLPAGCCGIIRQPGHYGLPVPNKREKAGGVTPPAIVYADLSMIESRIT
jgi:hypothetical protein